MKSQDLLHIKPLSRHTTLNQRRFNVGSPSACIQVGLVQVQG